MTDLEPVRANIEVLRYVKARMADLKEMQENNRAVIEEALGNNEIGTLDGQPVIAFKHVTSTRVDQKKLKEEYPEIADKCMSTSTTRRFEVL